MDKRSLSGTPGTPAVLRYDLSDFTIITPGAFVVCAVTGKPIPLDDLRYWNPERQEPYIDADASSKREREIAEEGN